MKTIKNTIAALVLTAILGLGATTANAGLLMSDFAGNPQPSCTVKDTAVNQLTGILIVGFAGSSSLTGILMSDFAPTCTEPTVSNSTGILIVG